MSTPLLNFFQPRRNSLRRAVLPPVALKGPATPTCISSRPSPCLSELQSLADHHGRHPAFTKERTENGYAPLESRSLFDTARLTELL